MSKILAKWLFNNFKKKFTTTIPFGTNGKIQINWLKIVNEMFHNDTHNYNMSIPEDTKFEEINFKSHDDLNLSGIVLKAPEPSTKWVVAMHGYSSSKLPAMYHAYFLHKLNYNILAFDFRNHGQSDEAMITFGWNEVKDLNSALNYIKNNYKFSEINLIGASMGAFTANYFSAKYPEVAKEVNMQWIIADSSPKSAVSVLEHLAKINENKFSEFAMSSTINELINLFKTEYDVDLLELDFTKNYKLPGPKTLYIHTKDDGVVDYHDSIVMYQLKQLIDKKNHTQNEIKLFEDGGHTHAQVKHYDEFIKATNGFVLKTNK